MSANIQQARATLAPSLGWLSETWRLARWQLFLIWRRTLAKVLLGLLLAGFALVLVVMLLVYASSGEAEGVRDNLTFPLLLRVAGFYTQFVGVVLVPVLAGSLVGGEYTLGTMRLILPRGTTRAQLLTAQVIGLALLALITTGLMLLLATLLGLTIGPALGASLIWPSGALLWELAQYWLAVSFQLFAYALLALFAGTLGRSVLAGVALPLGFVFLEFIISNVIVPIAVVLTGGFGAPGTGLAPSTTSERLSHIPDWLLGSNVGAIVVHVGEYPLALYITPTTISMQHALLVALVYCVVLIVGSYLLLARRDVTD